MIPTAKSPNFLLWHYFPPGPTNQVASSSPTIIQFTLLISQPPLLAYHDLWALRPTRVSENPLYVQVGVEKQ